MKKLKTIIIAEAGVNHNGSVDLAKKMIETAFEAGADFIKFQTFESENLVTENTKLARYQKVGSGEIDQLTMLKKLELSEEDFIEIHRHCTSIGIKFLSTPFDVNSLEILDKFDMDFIKIASGELTNYPFLVEICKRKKPIICSTGMSTIEEIKDALSVFFVNGIDKEIITILQCNTQYPTPYSDVNLNAMIEMKSRFDTRVGFSDHTLGIEASLAAVAMGASIIEKHFTIDNNLPGPDHKASLNPYHLNNLISSIRNIEKSFGNDKKMPTESEKENLHLARKSIVAKIDIQEGEIFTEQNLTTKRPGTGLSPMKWTDIIGHRAKCNFRKDDFIK